jgi:N utilization substance protein A
MSTIKLDDQTLRYITLFEGLTQTNVKDCLEKPDTIYFVIKSGQFHKAIGKNGANVKRLRGMLHKNIKVIEYSPEPETFIRNIFVDFQINEIRIEDSKVGGDKVAIVSVNPRDKGKIIGRDSKNLKIAREILSRHNKLDMLIK